MKRKLLILLFVKSSKAGELFFFAVKLRFSKIKS
jgi:hypothetical protein